MVEAFPADSEIPIPKRDALIILAVHSYIPSQGNPRAEFLEAILKELQGRDISITFSMPKSYFEKAVKVMGLEKMAGKYGAKIVQPHQNANYKIELESPRGAKIRVRALEAAFDESLLKIVVAIPVSHPQTILYLTTPTAALQILEPKDSQNLYEGFRPLYKYIAEIYKMEKNTLCIADGKFVIEGDGPIKGFQRYWGVAVVGENCADVDYATAQGLGINPEDLGYLYFYYGGNWPKTSLPPLLEKNKISIKLTSNVGILLSWKRGV
ncbi:MULTISPECIES: DUF362 domain-containing protein [Pyrobaculum]|uniref:DUF362 domain-containing protein n=2 Tax=Pyrobaculum TaxID=2276 RepID=A0A7L4PDI1_9CREN|nr:DUF362 domain-containing protein [Pyrobaculum arsenaticum]AFA38482.1 hypothetical protein Pogu_0455 [Pyrobaculum oguniense TE7]MCY0891812.1 hypothetical protein [Pyrobaculum arsenaticum]NYR16397.1 hypothetical protein [Pyrobaculum arsenaticum]